MFIIIIIIISHNHHLSQTLTTQSRHVIEGSCGSAPSLFPFLYVCGGNMGSMKCPELPLAISENGSEAKI